MNSIIAFNVLALIFLPLLAAFFVPTAYNTERAFVYVWSFVLIFTLSFWGWVIFVAVHFASKYW